ncbi:MAG: Hsp20/alpha crystallin family protein [Gammaproteobacteria bacterium]|nr:Hsp20/alpha crystallin family protein [Gammaproteobacteria bacterium]
MSMIRYEPWSLHRDLINEVNRLFERSAGDDASSGATADWAPPVDIEEYTDKFVIETDVPGIEPDSIEVTLENGMLTLSGTRERRAQHNGVQARREERASGRFYRRFNLPDTVDADAVSAHGKNGVLEIVIPKRPTSQPRKINVNR